MIKTNYILIALLFGIGQVFISFPYIVMDSAYAMGKPDNPGSQGNQGQGGGNANAGGNNPKAQANKNKNKNKNQPRAKKRQRMYNNREYRVNYFCIENKEVCGQTNRKRIIRTDEEKRQIAQELIDAINRSRGY